MCFVVQLIRPCRASVCVLCALLRQLNPCPTIRFAPQTGSRAGGLSLNLSHQSCECPTRCQRNARAAGRAERRVRDFAAREEKLEQRFPHAVRHRRQHLGRAQSGAGIGGQQREAEATDALAAEENRRHDRFEQRKAWINRAHAAVSQKVLGEISERTPMAASARSREWTGRTSPARCRLAHATDGLRQFQQI